MSTTQETIKKRIIKISNKIRVTKEGKNNYKGFNYFRPDDIMIKITPLLEKYNLIDIFQMEYSVDKNMYEGRLDIEDCDTADKVSYKFDIPLTKVSGGSEAQNAGATQTYCKRYMLMNAFNIADNSLDPDADEKEYSSDDFARAKRMIKSVKNADGLLEYLENLKKSKKFNKNQKAELESLISIRVDELNYSK